MGVLGDCIISTGASDTFRGILKSSKGKLRISEALRSSTSGEFIVGPSTEVLAKSSMLSKLNVQLDFDGIGLLAVDFSFVLVEIEALEDPPSKGNIVTTKFEVNTSPQIAGQIAQSRSFVNTGLLFVFLCIFFSQFC